MAGIQLTVTPSELKNKSDEISGQVNSVKRIWKQLGNVITKSKRYWEGEASEYHQKSYHEIKDEMDQAIRRLGEHPEDLQKMAGVYEKAETRAKQKANALPTNVIR